jgi:dipeptidase E
MAIIPKLLLYSMSLHERHFEALEKLTGKITTDIQFACIENAADIMEGSGDWVPRIRQSLIDTGYQVEAVDLRNWLHNNDGLFEKLQSKDVIWLGGGHTYYLRWILKASGADNMIKELVAAGKVYAGWSAGAIMAGPTTKYFDLMGDDPADAPELIEEGLRLTDKVMVPHMDHADFGASAKTANQALLQAGFKTVPLHDNLAIIIVGDTETII